MTALFHDIVVLFEAPATATERDLEDHALAALVAWRGTPEGLILPRVLSSTELPDAWQPPLQRRRDAEAFRGELVARKGQQRDKVKHLMHVPLLDDEPLAQVLLLWSEDLLAWMADEEARAPGCTEMGPLLTYLHDGVQVSLADLNFFDEGNCDHLVTDLASYAETETLPGNDLWLVGICAIGAWSAHD